MNKVNLVLGDTIDKKLENSVVRYIEVAHHLAAAWHEAGVPNKILSKRVNHTNGEEVT